MSKSLKNIISFEYTIDISNLGNTVDLLNKKENFILYTNQNTLCCNLELPLFKIEDVFVENRKFSPKSKKIFFNLNSSDFKIPVKCFKIESAIIDSVHLRENVFLYFKRILVLMDEMSINDASIIKKNEKLLNDLFIEAEDSVVSNSIKIDCFFYILKQYVSEISLRVDNYNDVKLSVDKIIEKIENTRDLSLIPLLYSSFSYLMGDQTALLSFI